MVKLYLKPVTFNRLSKFSTWVYSVCCNHCVDYIRKKRTELHFTIIENQHSDQYYESANEPSDGEIITFEIEKIKLAFNIIDPEETILLLKCQDGVSINNLAQILDNTRC